jgi:hypothetical protein
MPKDRRDLTRGGTQGRKPDRGAGGQLGGENSLFSTIGQPDGGGTGSAGGNGARPVGLSSPLGVGGGDWWKPEERDAKLAQLREKYRLLHTDEAMYQQAGRALALFVEYAELRAAGATQAQLVTASEAMATSWSDVARTAWGVAIHERRRA